MAKKKTKYLEEGLICFLCLNDKFRIGECKKEDWRYAQCPTCKVNIFYEIENESMLIDNLMYVINQGEIAEPDEQTGNIVYSGKPVVIKRQYHCPTCLSKTTKVKTALSKKNKVTCRFKCFDCEITMFLNPRYLYRILLLEDRFTELKLEGKEPTWG